MLETRAVVVHVEENSTRVQSTGASGCSVCEGKGCGSSKVTQLFCNKPRHFEVENKVNARVGDEVIISVVEGAVLQGVGLVYLLPLVMLFLCATLSGRLAVSAEQQDGYAAVGAVFGVLLGFAIAKWVLFRQSRKKNKPYITRLVSGT